MDWRLFQNPGLPARSTLKSTLHILAGRKDTNSLGDHNHLVEQKTILRRNAKQRGVLVFKILFFAR
jgi:hypothetical protein